MAPDIPAADGSSPKTQRFDGPPPMVIDPAKRYTAELVTSKGTMTIALDAGARPEDGQQLRVPGPLALLRRHRLPPDHPRVHAPGGDPEGSGRGGPGYRFDDELPAPGRYEIGSLAMANAGPNTNGSQFFIVSGPDGTALPPSYSLFGKVVERTRRRSRPSRRWAAVGEAVGEGGPSSR